MSDKDMNAPMKTESLTQTVRKHGSVVEEIVTKPDDSEDALLNDLARDLPSRGALNAFGNFDKTFTDGKTTNVERKPTSVKRGSTGFVKFEQQHDSEASPMFDDEVDGDGVIKDAILESRQRADAVYKPKVIAAFKEIQAKHTDMPENWRDYPQIVNAVVSKISKDLDLPEEMIQTYLGVPQ